LAIAQGGEERAAARRGWGGAEGAPSSSSGINSCSFVRKTCVLVTAQLHNCHLADRVVVMEGGRVVEQGSYAVLSAPSSGSHFASMLAEADLGTRAPNDDGARSPSAQASPSSAAAEASQALSASPTAAAGKASPGGGGGGGGGGGASSRGSNKEVRKTGAIALAVWKQFGRAGVSSWFWFTVLFAFFIIAEVSFVTIDSWLAVWADDQLHWARDGHDNNYIAIYALLTVFYFGLTVRGVRCVLLGGRSD
jgi:hypothetical protein